MIRYQVEYKASQYSQWMLSGLPLQDVATALEGASSLLFNPGFETRLRGIATELQPDGTITRRELSPDELAAAIRGEQEPTKPVKAVVVVWDEYRQHEAVYVDGELFMATDLTQGDELDASGLETIAAGQPITIRACQMDRPIEDWPQGLGALRLED